MAFFNYLIIAIIKKVFILFINSNETENPKEGSQLKSTLSDKKYILLITSLSYFLCAFSVSVISIALRHIGDDFEISAVAQTWIATIFFLSIAIFSLPFGKIAGKFGLKRTFYLGLMTLAVASFGSFISPSVEFLIAFRALQGLGVAILNVSTLAILVESMPLSERGKGIGIITAAAYVGLVASEVIGGFLTHNFGWRSIFLVVIPFLMLTAVITYLKVPNEWKFMEGSKFDYIGAAIFAAAISLFIYGLTVLNTLTGGILVIISIVLFALFGIWELKVKDPMYPVKILKNKGFTFASIAAILCSFATFAVLFIVTYHLQIVKGMPTDQTGVITMLLPISMAVSTVIAGHLSDKFNPRIIASSGLGIIFIALVILSVLDKTTPLFVIITAIILQGVGYGMFVSPNTNIVVSALSSKLAPIATATVSTTRVIGEALSLGMLTLVFAIFMGSLHLIPENSAELILSSQVFTILAGIICVLAIVFSLIGVNSKNKVNS
ncbi:MAG: MFS transporter [Methanosarcinales archaeon]|nr:MFS transporter [Methanosarcinales archaeon]